MVHQRPSARRSRSPACTTACTSVATPGDLAPECGYAPGIDRYLAAENIRFFFVDSHALANAVPRPRRAVYAPGLHAQRGGCLRPRSGELDAGLERRV